MIHCLLVAIRVAMTFVKAHERERESIFSLCSHIFKISLLATFPLKVHFSTTWNCLKIHHHCMSLKMTFPYYCLLLFTLAQGKNLIYLIQASAEKRLFLPTL